MSGIVGFVDATPRRPAEELTALVERMARRLIHRGPDDEGSLVDPALGLALGFRRLAIQDLSRNGNQPMISANRRYVMVYNGETYNFRELREELQRAGYRAWRGSSDTEVLLAAIQRIGVAGMLDISDAVIEADTFGMAGALAVALQHQAHAGAIEKHQVAEAEQLRQAQLVAIELLRAVGIRDRQGDLPQRGELDHGTLAFSAAAVSEPSDWRCCPAASKFAGSSQVS